MKKETVFLSSRSLTLDWPDRRMMRWQAMWRHAGTELLRSCWTGCTTIRMVRRSQAADFFRRFLTSLSLEASVPTLSWMTKLLSSLLQLIFGQWGALWESFWRGKSFFLATIVSFISMPRVRCCLQLLFSLLAFAFHYFFKVPHGHRDLVDLHYNPRPFWGEGHQQGEVGSEVKWWQWTELSG